MARALALCAALMACSSEAAEDLRIAVMSFAGVDVAADRLSFEGEHFAQAMRGPGLKVITSREMSTLLGLERQRQLMGCEASSSGCIAELAAALGADAVVVGDVGHFGSSYQVNVKALSGSDARVIASHSTRVDGELVLLDALTVMGRMLASEVLAKRRHGEPVSEASLAPTRVTRPWGWLPIGVAAVTGIAGGVLFGLAHADAMALSGTGEMLSTAQADSLKVAGVTKQGLGVAFLAASGVSVLVAVGLFIFGKEPIVISLAPGQSSVGLTFGGVFQ